MIKEKISQFTTPIKNQAQNIIFSLLSGWLFTLVILMIKESILPEIGEKIDYTSVATKSGEELIDGYADFMIHENLLLFFSLIINIAIILFCLNKFIYKKTLLFALPTAFLSYSVLSVYNASVSTPQRAFPAFVFTALAAVILVLCINYVKKAKTPLAEKDISLKSATILLLLAFAAVSAFYIYLLWARTLTYCSPGFDMGIFAQMLDNMTESEHSFLPMVTCERGEYLSHFAVHFSPILYLLVPFCYIFDPLTVLVFAQIILVFSGVFPLFLICRQLKLSNAKSLIISLLFLLYPAMSSGAFYDFHENAFLAPLILWTLYFSHKRGKLNTLLMFVFALLTLMVKEDAAIYVAFIALFVFFSQRQRLKGFGLFVLTVCYFVFAIFMISQFGEEGTMLGSRYNNIIGANTSFTALVTTFIVNPALYAAEIFTADKLIYALNMLLPLAFLPLVTRKPSRFLLLGPFLIMNLVTDYQYQYDLGFQYSFGSGALLIYLAAINVADMSFAPMFSPEDPDPEEIPALENVTVTEESEEILLSKTVETEETKEIIQAEISSVEEASTAETETETEIEAETEIESEEIEAEQDVSNETPIKEIKLSSKKKFINNIALIALIFSVFASVFILAYRAPGQTTYAKRLKEEDEIRATIEETLAKIDRDKSVLASSMFVTALYDVDELYETNYSLQMSNNVVTKIKDFTDYVVLDARPYISTTAKNQAIINKYKLYGYEIIEEHEGVIIVLQRTEKSPPVGPAE